VLRLSLVAGFFLASVCACGGNKPASFSRSGAPGGPSSRIEARSISERPPLALIERGGDPEGAIAFASLASASADVHASFGELLSQRLIRAGHQSQVVAHGLGFELMILAESPARARAALQALYAALAQPVAANELPPSAGGERAAPSALALCSAELTSKRRVGDAAELERERVETFAQDRSAFAVVGDAPTLDAVADALSEGPDWPERGAVRSLLPAQGGTQTLRGERATLSVALTLSDADRALGAAAELDDSTSALGVRLSALGGGFKLRRVTATAHPGGACLRLDSDVDSSPVPEAKRLGFAVHLMTEEAELALSRGPRGSRLEAAALSATDPRLAARVAAYSALLDRGAEAKSVRLIALTAPDEAPLAPSIDAAVEQARNASAALETRIRVEQGQPGVWALLSSPCAAVSENGDDAGHSAVLFAAAASSSTAHGVKLEPWVGAQGAGLVGFAERGAGESDAEAAARLGDALGRAALAPPSALSVASARAELASAMGSDARPLLDALLDSLAAGRTGALAPRGTAISLQSATREAVLFKQRELLRAPHRLAILSPTNDADAATLTRALSRWLSSAEPPRASPCGASVGPPSRGELSLARGIASAEGSYVSFRIPASAGSEAAVLAELLSAPSGALARALSEPDLVGAARATVVGTSAARALVVQVSAFDGRENEALARVQRLFERLSSDGVLGAAELEGGLARLRAARRDAALEPRFRLVQLLDPSVAAPVDASAVRRLAATLRPESAVIARARPR
jgi:hypothetical protein